MTYEIIFLAKAKSDLKRLKKSEPLAYQKTMHLIEELKENSRIGTGKPEMKKYNLKGFYSRRITEKHRLIYSINDNILTVEIISARSHYGDK